MGCTPMWWHRSITFPIDKRNNKEGCNAVRLVNAFSPDSKVFYSYKAVTSHLPLTYPATNTQENSITGACGARIQTRWRSTLLRPLPKVATFGSQRRPQEPCDLRLIEAANPLATTKEQRSALGKLWFKEKRRIKRLVAKHKQQRQIELTDWSWNTKKQRTREIVDEMVDKDGNIWEPDAWPDLLTKHFVDLYKALEVEIMAEKRELQNLSCAAMKHRWTSTCRTARACLEMALEITERKKQARRIR